MTATANPRNDVLEYGPGPYFICQMSSNSTRVEVGTIASFSSGKLIRAAADAIRVVTVMEVFQDDAGDWFARVDGSGAIIEVVYSSAGLPGTGVKISDNQTVLATTDPTKWAGTVVKVVSTNVARIQLRPISEAPYAS